MLSSLNARHIVAGLFILDKQIQAQESGGILLDEEVQKRLDEVLSGFIHSLDAFTMRPAAAVGS